MKINQEASVIQCKTITINAKPKKIWKILVSVQQWPLWNINVKNVELNEELKVGSEFKWISGGAKIKSKIHTLNQCKTLGWTGKTFGGNAIHNWYFEDVEGGTKIIVEESMEGWLVSLFKNKMNSMLAQDMEQWLEQLKTACEI